MKLGLSSAAARDAPLGELLDAAARRGFGALELREGDAHGITPDADVGAIGETVRRATAAGVTITGYRTGGAGHDLALARLSHTLGAPILLEGPEDLAGRIARARQMRNAGAAVAIVLRGESVVQDGALAAALSLPLAWDADPRVGPPGRFAEALLRRTAGALRHICLSGGGPETTLQDGMGVGDLMRHLALAGYEGTLVLAPSTTRYRLTWRSWLGHRGGGGCGSKVAETPARQLTTLAMEGAEG